MPRSSSNQPRNAFVSAKIRLTQNDRSFKKGELLSHEHFSPVPVRFSFSQFRFTVLPMYTSIRIQKCVEKLRKEEEITKQ